MKYIKLFDTHAEYEAAESSLILPNVSFCVDTPNEIHYNPSSPVPPTPSHDYVEIGGLKWATMNIGAEKVTDTGLYFQWGDTQGYTASQVGSDEGKKYFGWADYKYSYYGGSSASDMTKYNNTDGKTVLLAEDDAVTAAWGGQWRMPTEAEFQTLFAATTNTWVTNYEDSGVNGRLFTDKNDSSKELFFPAAGICGDGSVNFAGSVGNYWSSSLDASDVVVGRRLNFNSGNCKMDYNNRRNGYAVRGVVG